MTELILALVALGSITFSILDRILRLRWSVQYRDAQEQVVKAKDAQIETLERDIESLRRENEKVRELNPAVLQEWSAAATKIYEKQVRTLNDQLADKDRELEESRASGIASAERVENLVAERDALGVLLDSSRVLLDSARAKDVAHHFQPGSTFAVAVGPLKGQHGKVLERCGGHTVRVQVNVMEDLVTEMDERTLNPTREKPLQIAGIRNPQTGEMMRIDFDSSRLVKEE